MKKIFLLLVCLIFTCNISLASWFSKKDKPFILFNKNQITKDNVMDYTSEFDAGRRIYYLIAMPKEQYSRRLYIQIVKKDNAYERQGYNLVWTSDVKLKDEDIASYEDYVVINQPGCYVMQVFSKDRPTKVYAESQFWVR
ncbi:MAG: hypothetical protein LKG27_01725 [Clostridiaceae bacterium]|jgi:hypothetical protein|nr:hypothetical protein [Clostridiaceae bacterium]